MVPLSVLKIIRHLVFRGLKGRIILTTTRMHGWFYSCPAGNPAKRPAAQPQAALWADGLPMQKFKLFGTLGST